VFGLATLTAASLLAAESSPNDAITNATAKLAQQANYSWKTTTAFGNFNGEDRDVDRTTTVEIKDVGTTKIDVPEAAKKKLSAAAPEAAKEGSKS